MELLVHRFDRTLTFDDLLEKVRPLALWAACAMNLIPPPAPVPPPGRRSLRQAGHGLLKQVSRGGLRVCATVRCSLPPAAASASIQ